jgi:hypothetical protein
LSYLAPGCCKRPPTGFGDDRHRPRRAYREKRGKRAAFFCECLGWKVIGENQSYPANVHSNGNAIVTLWQVEDPDACVPFDRHRKVGLHHLAVKIADPESLEATHARVAAWPDVIVSLRRLTISNRNDLSKMNFARNGVDRFIRVVTTMEQPFVVQKRTSCGHAYSSSTSGVRLSMK